MVTKEKNILVVAGEVSGDLHGASLLKELKIMNPSMEMYGIGGDEMIKQGFHALYHINKMAFLGFTEVVRHLPFISKVKSDLVKTIGMKKIKTAILIDYPGFNLNFAKKLKQLGIRVIYYISPQIWAWGKGRIKKIKRLVDKMLVIIPFEEKMYRDAGIDAVFVGNPLVEQIENYRFISRDEFFNKFQLDPEKEILLVLPGSRVQEVERIYPVVIEGAEKLAERFNMQIVVACAPLIDETVFSGLTGGKQKVRVVHDHVYDCMRYAKFGIVKSGTSTLQAGLLELPMIIVYKTNPLTFAIGKRLVTIKNIGLANIVAGEDLVPELIQNEVRTEKIVETASSILDNPEVYQTIREKLANLRKILGAKKASKNSAEIITRYLNEN